MPGAFTSTLNCRWIPTVLGVSVLFCSLLNPVVVSAQGQNLSRQTPPKNSSVILYHAVADGSAKTLPKELAPYRSQLRRVSAGFRLAGKKRQSLTPSRPTSVDLPSRLGKAIITVDPRGTLTVKIMDSKGKSLGTYRSSRMPFLLVNDKLKVGGKDYVLIIDRPRPPKGNR